MNAVNLIEQAAGVWEGEYRLWFQPGPPETECATRATVTTELEGHSLLLRYDWTREETVHLGIAVISRAKDAGIEMGWSDTFHSTDGVMHCTSLGAEAKVLAYYGPTGEQWGWRTEFAMPSFDALEIRAFNISPGGDETLATEAIYRRVG